MAPRKPNISSKKRKRKFKKTSPPPRLSTAQIRRLTVDGEAVTDAPFVPDVLRSGRFKNVELGMKDMPAGYEEGGRVGKKKVLPKPKPRTSTNKKTGATRGAGDDKEYMRKAARANMNKGGGLNAAIERVKKVQGMQEGGRTISDADMMRIDSMLGALLAESGRTISDADKQRMGTRLGGMAPRKRGMGMKPKGKKMGQAISDADVARVAAMMGASDADMARVATMMGATDRQLMGMEEGGAVPKKFKGFSKLPEDVQQQMNPTLAAKYEDGGVVRGMGRAYMGKPRKVKIR